MSGELLSDGAGPVAAPTPVEGHGLQGRVDAVVIGASAGGIEALLVILPMLSARLAAPVFVVVHLPRDARSLLVPVFGPRCAAPVVEVEDKMPVAPGTIYFAPPDYHLLIDRGPALALSADDPVNWSRPSIDVLFESAVDVYGWRVAGVVLTGANEDGAAGLAAVHRAGGIAIVQNPDQAVVSIMPAAALGRVAAATILPLDGIGSLLRTLDDIPEGKPHQ